jgi:hypothetical protein
LQIDRPARTPAEAAGRFDRHFCIRQRIPYRLMLDNWVDAASPLVTREVKCRPHHGVREDPDQRGRPHKTGGSQRETTAQASHNIVARHADILEPELLSPPAETGMHFRRNPTAIIAS